MSLPGGVSSNFKESIPTMQVNNIGINIFFEFNIPIVKFVEFIWLLVIRSPLLGDKKLQNANKSCYESFGFKVLILPFPQQVWISMAIGESFLIINWNCYRKKLSQWKALSQLTSRFDDLIISQWHRQYKFIVFYDNQIYHVFLYSLWFMLTHLFNFMMS